MLIADCETDGLLPDMTKLHMIQAGDADTDEVTIYCDTAPPEEVVKAREMGLTAEIKPLEEGIKRVREAPQVVFQNGIGFDFWAINRFFPGTIRRERLLDTLVLARLKDPEERNHTLKAWGERTGTHKGDYKGDFQRVDAELLVYAEQDIPSGRAMWHAVKEVLEWGESAQLEHDVAWAINAQERNGFCFDAKSAQELDAELRGEQAELNVQLQAAFKPLERIKTFTPKVNNKKLGYTKGVPFTKRWYEQFNPASRQHVAERLQRLGWKPKSFGDNGIATVDEKTLADLPWPEAKLLVSYFRLLKMIGQLSDGKNGWLKMVRPTGRIHGRVNPNGACTGRMSHFQPNVAQADKDHRMRSLWIPRDGWKLVGCDAEGLEARMLAHYLARYDGGAFTKRLLEGRKEDATDVHSANRDAVRNLLKLLIDRDGAKTLLYALMYGAGDYKLGQIVKDNLRDQGKPLPKVPNKELGGLVRRALARSMVGIDKLTTGVKAAAKTRGYLLGLDGRHLFVRSEHAALNTLLQGGGAVVMKKALVLFLDEVGWEHSDFMGLCANVHDEVQMEVIPERAEEMGQAMAQSIARAGQALGIRCPLAGAFDVGSNWAQTH